MLDTNTYTYILTLTHKRCERRMTKQATRETAEKIVELLAHGLTKGLGKPVTGQMREAARVHQDQIHKDALELAAQKCDNEGDVRAANAAANAATIYVSANALAISAKNSAFPKVADIMALRMLRQADFNIKGLRSCPDGGFIWNKMVMHPDTEWF